MTKKKRKNNFNLKQKSFFFEDYIATNLEYKKNYQNNISSDRIYLLFFSFLSLILVFSLKILYISFQKVDISNKHSIKYNYLDRRDITDRNDILISRNVISYHAAIRSSLIQDKDTFGLKLKLLFPELSIEKLNLDLSKKKYFYLKKRLNERDYNVLWALGEKGIIFEPFQTRIYPQSNLFSHVLGQVDYDNFGISGIEKYLDKELKKKKLIQTPLVTTLDSNVQYLVRELLRDSIEIFSAESASSLIMNPNNGEIISLVSLPDFNINSRNNLSDKKFMNNLTKGVYELGSIFKTFTIALAIEKDLVEPETIIKDIPNEIKCSKYTIKDHKDFPKDLSVEDILIRSSNIGSIIMAKKIGEINYKNFIIKSKLLEPPTIELNERGKPLKFKWDKCKLETVSFGHGITTTPVQAATVYSSLINGGFEISPTLLKNKDNPKKKRIFSQATTFKLKKILRQVVTDKNGTASLADIPGYYVSGKTGTSEYYEDEKKNINTFLGNFSVSGKDYIIMTIFDNPKIPKDLIYDYRGVKIKASRNEAGWNSAYVAGKIIEKIGPILAINNDLIANNAFKKDN